MQGLRRGAALTGVVTPLFLACGIVEAADCVSGAQSTGSCDIPLGVIEVDIQAVGGGGGGGRDALAFEGAGGGGGGAFCGAPSISVTPGEMLTVIVGTGGDGATTSNPGDPGTDSSVSSSSVAGLVASGGAGGEGDNGGAGGSTTSCTLAGATLFSGGNGGNSTELSDSAGGGGGGGAGATGAGGNGANSGGPIFGGAGGAGGSGAPSGGAGGDGGNRGTDGADGTAPGGGGGGAGYAVLSQGNGGNGADGTVIITLGPETNYTITENPQPQAGGTVTCNPTSVLAGDDSQCTAIPEPGYELVDWADGCAGTQGDQCDLSAVLSDLTATANFRQLPPPPVAQPVPSMSAVGLGALSGLLGLFGVWAQRRRGR